MAFNNRNISTIHVADEETKNALVRIEKQFKQIYDMILTIQDDVKTLKSSKANTMDSSSTVGHTH